MNAAVGDRIVVRGHYPGEPDRDAEILEVHGDAGTPPYLVRWDDDGHVGLFVPGPDARVDHLVEDVPLPEDPEPETAAQAADPPIVREVREGIVAIRADAARLRAALSVASRAGSDLVSIAHREIAHTLRVVECEAEVLWAQVRAAEADGVSAVRDAVDDAMRAVRAAADEARLQANLGAAEADDTWRQVSAVARRLADPAVTVDVAREIAVDAFGRLRDVARHAAT